MKKDVITVKLDDGSLKDMEVILTFSDEKTKQNYILYKDFVESNECYAAKYEMNGDLFSLDSNLTKKEIKVLDIVLSNVLKEKQNEN